MTTLTSFLCGYLAATVFDFTSLSAWLTKNFIDYKSPQSHVVVKATPVEKPKPKFEFYTLLSKDNSEPVVHHANSLSTPAKVGAPQTVSPPIQTAIEITAHAPSPGLSSEHKPLAMASSLSKEAYLIQIASFNKRQDAEHMQASLVLRGFDVTISSIAKQNTTWYRVNIGPFSSRIEAQKAQMAVARSDHLKGMIRRISA